MSEIIYGKPVADRITKNLTAEAEEIKKKGIQPKLVIVRVGAKPADMAYEKGVYTRCSKIGIEAEVKALPEEISQAALINEIDALNNDQSVHGILMFRPLPGHLNEAAIKHEISQYKDIDCFNPINEGRLYEGDTSGFVPCTPAAVIEILDYYGVEIRGKDAIVVGASNIVGKPMALLLLNRKATVTICNSCTTDLAAKASRADIIVAAVGRVDMIGCSHVKKGAVVIDVGINEVAGSICGDVDFDGIRNIAGMLTPVPGGVGTVTTSILAKHIIKACKNLNDIK